jgi:hypothetical protein
MSDLLTLLEILRRRKWSVSLFLVLLLGGYYLSGGERQRYVIASPDYLYRLEVYWPSRQYEPVMRTFWGADFAFARLYSNLPGNRFWGETQVYINNTEPEWWQWEGEYGGIWLGKAADSSEDVEFRGIPPIDPATRQELPVSSERRELQLNEPETLEFVANLDGSEATCDARRVVKEIFQGGGTCLLYPPPYPRCETRPKGEVELCRIEAARNYDISYRLALSMVLKGRVFKGIECAELDRYLDHFSGKRIARDIASVYKVSVNWCRPMQPDEPEVPNG